MKKRERERKGDGRWSEMKELGSDSSFITLLKMIMHPKTLDDSLLLIKGNPE